MPRHYFYVFTYLSMIYVFVYTCLFLHSEYASVLFIRMLCAHCVDLSSSHELQPISDISAR